MKPEDYAWNQHERETRLTKAIPSKSKIKLLDSVELRNTLEVELEKLPQKVLAQWALENAQPFLRYLDDELQGDPRIAEANQAFNDKIAGRLSAYEFRKFGFLANQLAKESTNEISTAAARTFAQAIATAHMRGHALVSGDYAVKTDNLLYPGDLTSVTKLRLSQLASVEDLKKGIKK